MVEEQKASEDVQKQLADLKVQQEKLQKELQEKEKKIQQMQGGGQQAVETEKKKPTLPQQDNQQGPSFSMLVQGTANKRVTSIDGDVKVYKKFFFGLFKTGDLGAGLKELSTGGGSVIVTRQLERRDMVVIEIFDRNLNEQCIIKGKVRYCEPDKDNNLVASINFVEIEDSYRDALARIIDHYTQKG